MKGEQSGVKDEIDFEWTGNQTNEVQTNYYWEGDVAGCEFLLSSVHLPPPDVGMCRHTR